MELEDWVRKDMRKYIKNHEPEIERQQPVRQEHLTLLDKDYKRKIGEALSQNRFHTAKDLFNELKRKFLETPPNHRRERRAYYRQLQQCYKDIYDWVADQHKTSRILQQLTTHTNVFDSSQEPVSIDKLRKQRGAPMPTVEEQMVQEDEIPQLAPPPKPDAGNEQESQQTRADAQELSMPDWEPANQHPLEDAPIEEPAAPPAQTESGEEDAREQAPDIPTPGWNPPADEQPLNARPDTETSPDTETAPSSHDAPPPPKVDERTVREHAASALLDEAEQLLANSQNKRAQRKLLEARFELERAEGGDPETRRRAHELERALAHALKTDTPLRKDAEVFSSQYLKGVQAMAAGDYRTAATHFLKRVQQTPHDRAAKIRLAECMEALNA